MKAAAKPAAKQATAAKPAARLPRRQPSRGAGKPVGTSQNRGRAQPAGNLGNCASKVKPIAKPIVAPRPVGKVAVAAVARQEKPAPKPSTRWCRTRTTSPVARSGRRATSPGRTRSTWARCRSSISGSGCSVARGPGRGIEADDREPPGGSARCRRRSRARHPRNRELARAAHARPLSQADRQDRQHAQAARSASTATASNGEEIGLERLEARLTASARSTSRSAGSICRSRSATEPRLPRRKAPRSGAFFGDADRRSGSDAVRGNAACRGPRRSSSAPSPAQRGSSGWG